VSVIELMTWAVLVGVPAIVFLLYDIRQTVEAQRLTLEGILDALQDNQSS